MTALTPRLSLNFTTATLDPRITFTRAANTATVTNSAGLIAPINANLPRFDYDPITLSCRGLLVEGQSANLLPYSERFNEAAWLKTNTTVAFNDAVAPDGNLTADKIIVASGSVQAFITQSYTWASGTTYVMSVFAKEAGFRYMQLTFPGTVAGTGQYANFDLRDGIVTFQTGGNASIRPAANGYWRVSWSATATANVTAAVAAAIFIDSPTAGRVANATGNGVSGAHLWGSQLESGVLPTSYIPTSTTSVVRNADVATITGANFSDWWQASKSGVLVRARPGTVSGVRPWVQFDDGTANEIIALRGNTTNPELYIVDGGTPQAQIDAGTIAADTDYSLTGWWETNDCKTRLDSGAVVADDTATIPTVTQARLGSDGTNYLNGHLATVNYYDTFSSQIYTRRKNKAIFSLL